MPVSQVDRQLVDEILVAQAQWLPQYAEEIPQAKERLAQAKPLGTRTWQGAARKTTEAAS